MCKIVVLGVGNIFRSDDGLGSLIADRFAKNSDIPFFNAGTTPENYLEKVLKYNPEIVLIIDTVEFEGCPGEIRIFEKDELLHRNFSTHGMSLKMVMEYLKNRGVKEVKLIGVQPRNTQLGEGLSKEVGDSMEKVLSLCMNYR